MTTRSRKNRLFEVLISWLPLETKGLLRFRKTKHDKYSTLEEIPNQYYDLPSDLLVEILSRLPFKDLARFRAVSRSWNSLLLLHHDSDLAMLKFRLAPQKPQLNARKLLLQSCFFTKLRGFKLLDYESGFYDERAVANLDFPQEIRTCDSIGTRVIGSCKGLVCLALHGATLVLWNPSTGVYRKLAWDHNPYDFHYLGDRRMPCSGFGYDQVSDDYKIIVEALHRKASRSKFFLFSLRKNSWKILPYNRYAELVRSTCQDNTGYFLNGALHWRTGGASDHQAAKIVAFSLVTETFYTIRVPMVFRQLQGKSDFVRLTILGGCLCVFSVGYYRDEKPGVWIMKEYGGQESWVRLIEFDCGKFNDERIVPYCVTKKGSFVVKRRGSELVLFNPKEKTVKKFRIPFYIWYNCISYEETLISPYAWEKERNSKPIRGVGEEAS